MENNFIKSHGLGMLRVILIVVAIIFIVIGIDRDEQTITLVRAINICLECIGIG